PDGEVRRPARGEREGNVLAQLGGVVVLAVLVEKGLDGGKRRDVALGHFRADGVPQRVIVGRRQVGRIADGIERGHDGEKPGAGVELAFLRHSRGNREGHYQEGRQYKPVQVNPPLKNQFNTGGGGGVGPVARLWSKNSITRRSYSWRATVWPAMWPPVGIRQMDFGSPAALKLRSLFTGGTTRSPMQWMISSGRGAIRATTSTGRIRVTSMPVRHATMAVVMGAKGKAGSPMKCSKLLSMTAGASLKPLSSTIALMRGSLAAANSVVEPPSDAPSAPILPPSTSARVAR